MSPHIQGENIDAVDDNPKENLLICLKTFSNSWIFLVLKILFWVGGQMRTGYWRPGVLRTSNYFSGHLRP